MNKFIEKLEQNNELLRVKEQVDPELEIAEVTDRISKMKDGGKALLFENTGTGFPVLINAFGSIKRMCLALGVENLDDVGKKIEAIFQDLSSPKDGLLQKLKMLPVLKGLSDWFPKEVARQGICQQVIQHQPDLSNLPILKCWPKDGGPFVTLPVVITKDPETGIRNVGMYRMQVFDKDKTGMHWHKHKVGARHFEVYKRRKEKMPVAVVLGGDPVYTYAATAPLPDHLDEFLFAGFLRNKRVEMVKCMTQDLEVPADADIVIEGYIDPEEEMIWEGPFGDHTGFYSLPDWYPAFHVTCITHKKGAIYPATIVGIPPQEDFYIGKATERIFLHPIKLAYVPEILDMELPAEGVAHNLTIVRIEKRYAGQGQKVIHSLWGAGQMMFNKVIIVLNEPVNNYFELGKILIENVDIENDLTINKGPLDVLDHAATKLGFGSKMGIDATKKFDEERLNTVQHKIVSIHDIALPEIIIASNNVLIENDLPVLFVAADFSVPFHQIIDQLSDTPKIDQLMAVVCLDEEVVQKDLPVIFWILLNNIDPKRDCQVVQQKSASTLYLDGRRKTKTSKNFNRDWPNIIVSDDATIQKVDEKWNSYGIGTFIASPSLQYKSLLFGNEARASD